ncbi:ricin-type beta-trefoil lectin domain protein [Streptomyces sp. ISL-22]|uniref:RICIN domain-containing protein n=1 Tax=unclassified Streptomyces TaxID=2593676 RepID=UPI001BE88376|nr:MULTISPECIES: RICIN domain-containing protein [unclassified Streptomyces]MBT2416848.1 ricin-type beta-trefoil lectin domain protein [Streptomyces sp. ISL-24]MBT2436147.1 ricin-type beta-trefoil lectin domain protein [Streptomyces sp. ISL-22]
MPTPHPPRPPYPPPGGVPEESDEGLAARLRGRPDAETAPSVALLMARHWQPVHAYAVICLASPADVADMVTAAAFHQVLDRLALGEPAAALRPRLLVAVRETVRQWSADDRIAEVLPDLAKPAGGRGMRTAKSMTPENRKLADRSFQALPGLSRCLLWHTEVEAEPLSVPAGLLGMDTVTASAALEQARDKFREGCVHAHRELAPTKDCRFYNRLLDVPIRRGGALLPDVQQHLTECRYCRNAAEQLSYFEGGLGVLIAEAVLGWGARRYLDTRPGRTPSGGPGTRGSARHGAGRRRLLSRVPAQIRRGPGGPRSSRTLLTGVGMASAGLIAIMLAAGLLSDDDGVDPAASATGGGTASQLPPAVSSSPPGTAQLPHAPRQTRLRNADAELCLDIRGEPKAGAGTELAECSADATQQWSYEKDGLLRSVAEPDLCLDSHADAGVVILGKCAEDDSKRADDVRYDLTVRGELLPRWDEQLAVAFTTADAGADIVVKVRDGSDAQRWLTDPVPTVSPGSLSSAEAGRPAARAVRLGEENA